MNPSRWLAAGALVLALAAGSLAQASGRPGLLVQPPRLVQPHTLINQDAHEVRFPSGSDPWQLVVFGYTHCPDVCPMTLHKTALLLKHLGTDSDRLRVVFVSIDSVRDDARAMKEYVGKFDARIVGLTGDPEALQGLANEFGVLTRRYQGKTAMAYTMVHSSLVYLVDPAGRVRMMYSGSTGIESMAADLRRLWRESSAGANHARITAR